MKNILKHGIIIFSIILSISTQAQNSNKSNKSIKIAQTLGPERFALCLQVFGLANSKFSNNNTMSGRQISAFDINHEIEQSLKYLIILRNDGGLEYLKSKGHQIGKMRDEAENSLCKISPNCVDSEFLRKREKMSQVYTACKNAVDQASN